MGTHRSDCIPVHDRTASCTTVSALVDRKGKDGRAPFIEELVSKLLLFVIQSHHLIRKLRKKYAAARCVYMKLQLIRFSTVRLQSDV